MAIYNSAWSWQLGDRCMPHLKWVAAESGLMPQVVTHKKCAWKSTWTMQGKRLYCNWQAHLGWKLSTLVNKHYNL